MFYLDFTCGIGSLLVLFNASLINLIFYGSCEQFYVRAHVNWYTLLLRKNYLVEKSIVYEKETNVK